MTDQEEWDLYDRHRVKLNKVVSRGDDLAGGEYHLVTHVCLINASGNILIQQRQPCKDGWPDKWDVTIGGSALTGETSQMAAERELFEEIGYRADLSGTRPIFTLNFKGGFDDYYVIKAEVDPNTLQLQASEVKAVRWATKDEILQMIHAGTFIPYHPGLIGLIFDMEDRYGAHPEKGC